MCVNITDCFASSRVFADGRNTNFNFGFLCRATLLCSTITVGTCRALCNGLSSTKIFWPFYSMCVNITDCSASSRVFADSRNTDFNFGFLSRATLLCSTITVDTCRALCYGLSSTKTFWPFKALFSNIVILLPQSTFCRTLVFN